MNDTASAAPVRDYPPLPDFETVEQHIYGACRRYITQDMLEPIHNLIRDAIDADRAMRAQAAPTSSASVEITDEQMHQGLAAAFAHPRAAAPDAVFKAGVDFGVSVALLQTAPTTQATPQPAVQQGDDTHAFKNFHRALCERFGYCHDEKDWRRDQVSLIEHIAAESQAVQRGDAGNESADLVWRRLALQFDEHRMQALWWLRKILDEQPESAWPFARTFLASPPKNGETVLAERIAALTTNPAAPVAQGDALTDTYVQQVPDKCDRIVWRGRYYHLPIDAAEHSYTEPSPMAKVAAALRQKAEQEDAAYQARRSDQGLMESEWGPMEDAPPHEDPPMHVAVVEGDDAVRTLQWNRDVAAFAYPVGTLLYAVKW